MNIKLAYLYRDGSNYKNYQEVIFSNPNALPSWKIEMIVRRNLIEGQWFIAKKWGLPDLHFKEYSWDVEIDHEWHEYDSIIETNEGETESISIEQFLSIISSSETDSGCSEG